MNDYETALRAMFKQYGFSGSPLTSAEIQRCEQAGRTVEQAYGVGCDAYCGFEFEAALAANNA